MPRATHYQYRVLQPDNVFQSAEKLAQRLGKSRSQLYTQALSNYLEQSSEKSVQGALDNKTMRLIDDGMRLALAL